MHIEALVIINIFLSLFELFVKHLLSFRYIRITKKKKGNCWADGSWVLRESGMSRWIGCEKLRPPTQREIPRWIGSRSLGTRTEKSGTERANRGTRSSAREKECPRWAQTFFKSGPSREVCPSPKNSRPKSRACRCDPREARWDWPHRWTNLKEMSWLQRAANPLFSSNLKTG